MTVRAMVLTTLPLAWALLCSSLANAAPPESDEQRALRPYAEKDATQIKTDCLAKATTDEGRATCNFIYEALTFDAATPEQRMKHYTRDLENCLKQARERGNAEMTEASCRVIHEYRTSETLAPAEKAAFFEKHRKACEAKPGRSKERCAMIKPRNP